MNLQLANTEEFIDGQFTGNLGEVLIRCVCRGTASLQLCSARIHCNHGYPAWVAGWAHKGLTRLYTRRCNNVLYMRGEPEGGEDADAMES